MPHEIIKKHCHKKVIVSFYNLGEKKLLKVVAFVTFPTSTMVLYEIHQRFKGHVLNEFRVWTSIFRSLERKKNENKKFETMKKIFRKKSHKITMAYERQIRYQALYVTKSGFFWIAFKNFPP